MKKYNCIRFFAGIMCAVLVFTLASCKKTISGPILTSNVSEDCEIIEIVLQNCSKYDSIRFSAWSERGGKDDMAWYSAQKNEDGNWIATVELKNHHSSGLYQIHAYGTKESKEELLCKTIANVAYAVEPDLTVEVSEDCETMTITLRRHGDYDEVKFPVWNEKNGQDDIIWYSAQKNEDGNWIAVVPMKNYHSSGRYQVHAYGTKESKEEFLCRTIASVAYAVEPDLTAEVSEDCETMTITLRRHEDYDGVDFPTWSEENGQDDIVWYSAQKNEDGNWIAVIPMKNHHSSGRYQIHAYGTNGSKIEIICTTTATVEDAITSEPGGQ